MPTASDGRLCQQAPPLAQVDKHRFCASFFWVDTGGLRGEAIKEMLSPQCCSFVEQNCFMQIVDLFGSLYNSYCCVFYNERLKMF